MDNSGSIRDYKDNLHIQINEIFATAEEFNKTIIFIPIGENEYIKADTPKAARQLFTFDNSYTYVAEAFQKADKEEDLIQSDDTVIIISDMEPDLTNTPSNWQLLACDYNNIIEWYETLIKWMKKDVSIHLLLLNAETIAQFKPDELKKDQIIQELKHNIEVSTKLERNHKNDMELRRQNNQSLIANNFKYFRTQNQNKRLITRVVKSLQSVLFDPSITNIPSKSISIYPTNIKENIFSIIRGIIDPTDISSFTVKLEIDPNVINLSHPDMEYIGPYIQLNAPSMICTNPVRKAEYIVVNGPGSSSPHDTSVHYHLKYLSGQFTRFFDILLTNQYTNNQKVMGIMDDPRRQQYDIQYANMNDLIHKILNSLNILQAYQAKDFPLGEKTIIVTLKTEYMKYLVGARLIAKPKNVSQIMLGKTYQPKLSNKIKYSDEKDTTKGQCSLKVKRQTDSEVCLSLPFYKDEYDPREIIIPLGTVNASMLRSTNNEIVFTDQKDIPGNIISRIKVMADKKAFGGNIELIGYDVNEYQKRSTFAIDKTEQIQELLPGSYRFNVVHSQKDSCLNIWLNPFHVDLCLPEINTRDCSQPQVNISAYCMEDQFTSFDMASPLFDKQIEQIRSSLDPLYQKPKLGPNELNGTFKDHLLGSPFFFKRLLEYTSQMTNESNNNEIIELWRRVYYRLYFDDKAQVNVLPRILYPALTELKFINDQTLIPKSHIYLKIILAQYSRQMHNEYLSPDERYMYRYILRRILIDQSGLKENFVRQLYLSW